MNIREQIISLLEKNRGEYISGSDIGDKLNISRSAVWKTIKCLNESGYQIKAVTNKGYCLLETNDMLSKAGIEKYLVIKKQFNFEIYNNVITSTNNLLKKQAINGETEGKVIVAVAQSEGRGRFKRSFYSPKDSGLYFSLLLQPDISAQDATLITTASAVAISRAIEKIANIKPQIKWVNDIFLNGKKIAGILTEANFNTETGIIDSVILGVGINIYMPKNNFPSELKSVAGFVFDKPIDDVRNRLLAEFLNNFWVFYENLSKRTFVNEYKNRSCILNREIIVYKNDKNFSATALDIDNNCRLLVEYKDGTKEYLSTGEVSIKPV